MAKSITLGPRGRQILGLSISEFGSDVWGGAHMAGGALARAFGAGALVAPIENLEAPYLPAWAKSGLSPAVAVVTAPDAIVVQRHGSSHAEMIDAPVQISVIAGKRIDGNGYKPGDKNKFSFGYDAPKQVDLLFKDKTKASLTDVDKILFLGGVEGSPTKVSGDVDEILGEVLGFDWRQLVEAFGIPTDAAPDPARAFGYSGSGPALNTQPQVANAYWGSQRAATAQRGTSAAAARLQAARDRQVALRAQLYEGTVMGGKKLDADKILGEVLGYDFWQILYNPAGLAMDMYNQNNPGKGSFNVQPQAQSAYWAGRRSAQQSSPLATSAQQRGTAAQQLQQQLRAEQAANLSAMRSQILPSTPSVAVSTPGALTYAPSLSPVPDSQNPGYLTDGTLDLNYPTAQTVSGLERSRHMEFKDLDDRVLGELNRDRGVSELTRTHEQLRDLGDHVIGDLSSGRIAVRGGVQADHDYLHGGDVLSAPIEDTEEEAFQVLGAALQRLPPGTKVIVPKSQLQPTAGFVSKTTPGGRPYLSIKLNKNAKSTPQKTLNTAKAIAARAQKEGARLQTAVKKLASAPAPKGAKVVGAGRIGTHAPSYGTYRPSFGDRVIGAILGRRPVAKIGPGVLHAMTQKLIDQGKKLGNTTSTYAGAIKTVAAAHKAAALKGKAATKIHGAILVGDEEDVSDWAEIVGDQFQMESMEILGSVQVVGTAPPDPNNPGYLLDGSLDPAYGASSGGVAGPPDYGANALFGTNGPPTLNDVKNIMSQQGMFAQDPSPDGNDLEQYTADTLPLGFVVYDGSQPFPFKGAGSYTVFFGTLPNGAPPYGGTNSGYEYHGSGGFDWALVETGEGDKGGYNGDKNYDRVDNANAAMASESARRSWGPLIGNPQGGWTRGLRFSPNSPAEYGGGPIFFWFFDTAMQVAPWAVQGILQAQLNDLLVQYAAAVTAGQTDYTNQMVQDQLDAQQAQTLQRQQAASDSQLNIQMQQQQAQEAAFEQQAGQSDYQMQQQAAQLNLQAQKQQLDYFAAHPDQMFAPADQGFGMNQGADNAEDVDWGENESEGYAMNLDSDNADTDAADEE